MAFTVPNRGKFYILNNAISSSTDLRCAAFKGTAPSAATIQDWNFLSEVEAASGVDEAAAAGYARVDLASVAVAEDDTGNLAKITAAAWTMASVAAGETWTMLVYYVEAASDAARTLIGVDVLASGFPTPGGQVNGPALEIDLT